MRYYLIAGEPSGDLHGANLMKGLKAHDPEAKFRFWGGDKMAGVGGSGNLAKHYKETSFFGIVEVIKNLRTIRRQMKECRQDVEAFAPDVLILVDYPGFNMSRSPAGPRSTASASSTTSPRKSGPGANGG